MLEGPPTWSFQVDLTKRETHFEFGANWAEFAKSLSSDKIQEAIAGLKVLAPDLAGKSFLDIGCGSGLSSLAALKLGASKVVAIDLDENSVATTEKVLTKFAPDADWTVEQKSILDVSPTDVGKYDVVHSWGVLHHTGAMWKAIDRAADLVADSGELIIAIYVKTPLCGAWKAEKAFYSKSSKPIQKAISAVYQLAFAAGLLATGRNPRTYINNYKTLRGMDWSTDIHDWLGGYPYESASSKEIVSHLGQRGFTLKLERNTGTSMMGLLGTGCGEYVFVKS
jgi:2-polyprenyl-6-hydroxyphenyl methylase/3-demethylubiquinone-9 3-methyltransferase